MLLSPMGSRVQIAQELLGFSASIHGSGIEIMLMNYSAASSESEKRLQTRTVVINRRLLDSVQHKCT